MIQFPSGFIITTDESIDCRLVLTKEEMYLISKDIRDNEGNLDFADYNMPEKYFCLCKDDGRIYYFYCEDPNDDNKHNEFSLLTGYFKVSEYRIDRDAVHKSFYVNDVEVPVGEEPIEHIAGKKVWAADQEFEANLNLDNTDINGVKILNTETANISVENTGTANILEANIQTENVDTANVLTENVQTANIGTANIQSAHIAEEHIDELYLDRAHIEHEYTNDANIMTAHIDIAHTGTSNVGTENVSISNINEANVATANIIDVNIENETVNISHIVEANINTENTGTANIQTANIVSEHTTTASIETANINTATIESAGINDVDIATLDVTTKAQIKDETVETSEIETATITNGNITNASIEDEIVNTSEINTAHISTATISSAGINDADIATLDVTTKAQIKDETVETSEIETATITSGNITTANINSEAVGTSEIGTAGIGTANVGTLNVGNTANINVENVGTLNVGTGEHITGVNGLDVDYKTITKDLEVENNAVIDKGLNVKQNSVLEGTLSVTGATTLANTLSVSGNTNLYNNLTVDDNKATVLGGTLEVKDDVTLDADLYTHGNLSVSGTTTLEDDLTINANTEINGNVDITGPIAATGTVDITGNVHVTGTIISTGDIKTKSDLYVEAQKAPANKEYALKIDANGKVIKEDFTNTTAQATNTDSATFAYVDKITTNEAGKIIENTSKVVTVAEGDAQGQFKLNSVNIDVNNLGTNDKPVFAGIESTEDVELDKSLKVNTIKDLTGSENLISVDKTNHIINVGDNTNDVHVKNDLVVDETTLLTKNVTVGDNKVSIIAANGNITSAGKITSVDNETSNLVVSTSAIVPTPVNDNQATNKGYVDTKINYNVHLEDGQDHLTYSADKIEEVITYRNLNTGNQNTKIRTLKSATNEKAGLMSKDDFIQLNRNTERIELLEGQTTRWLYTDKTDPTAAEIQAFVNGQLLKDSLAEPTIQATSDSHVWAEGTWYYKDNDVWTLTTSRPLTWDLTYGSYYKFDTDNYSGVAVVVDQTYHIWHYYQNLAIWKDDGVDTVIPFNSTTNLTGTIKHTEPEIDTDSSRYINAGSIKSDNIDGNASVIGWDELQTDLSKIRNDIAQPLVAGKVYKINDRVINDGILYRCIPETASGDLRVRIEQDETQGTSWCLDSQGKLDTTTKGASTKGPIYACFYSSMPTDTSSKPTDYVGAAWPGSAMTTEVNPNGTFAYSHISIPAGAVAVCFNSSGESSWANEDSLYRTVVVDISDLQAGYKTFIINTDNAKPFNPLSKACQTGYWGQDYKWQEINVSDELDAEKARALAAEQDLDNRKVNKADQTTTVLKVGLENSLGSVTAGSAASYTQGTFTGGSYTQGTFNAGSWSHPVADAWTAGTWYGTVTNDDVLEFSFNPGSFVEGTYSYTAPTHAVDSFTPATHSNDSFTANTPTQVTLPSFRDQRVVINNEDIPQ